MDEAQDFTRLELEFLLRINLFSRGGPLRPNDLGRVCFAFAGDQFQTLNPTGFRWEVIKATFVEKFIFELDAGRRVGRTDLNYRELQYNYRSSHKIVRFGNHVQAMPAALFRLPDLKPQTPWTTEKRAFQVTWFRAGDAAFWEKFRREPRHGCHRPLSRGGGSGVCAGRSVSEGPDPYGGRRAAERARTPARAKGCEYPNVVAYGFGEAAEVDVMEERDGTPMKPVRPRSTRFLSSISSTACTSPSAVQSDA